MPLADAPQSNKQHAVPQNIMDVEFKLVGDLTMRQFSYLIVLGLLAYLSFVVIPGIFKWPITITLALLAVALAFIPVQERGLDEWLVNFFRAINSPTERVWKKEPQIPTAFMYDNLSVVRQEMITLAPTSSRRKLEEYLRRDVENADVDPLDIPEKLYALKVREAFSEVERGSSVGVLLDEPLPEEDFVPEEKLESEINEEDDKDSKEVAVTEGTVESDTNLSESPAKNPQTDTDNSEAIKTETKKSASTHAPATIVKSRRYTSYRGSKKRSPFSDSDSQIYSSFNQFGRDSHSGRKFINLVPSSGGEIVLPIRGQRVLDTSESMKVQSDLDDKARKLNELLAKIREEEGLPAKSSSGADKGNVAKVVDKEATDVVDSLKKQNEDLSSEIDRLRGQIVRNKSMSLETTEQEQLLKKLEAQKSEIASSYAELSSQVQDLKKKLEEKEGVSTGEDFEEKSKIKLPVLTDKPNVVSGVVRDTEGKFFSDYLIIIKNTRGDTVRAFKTNSLGQFVVSTPLENGTYTVEVSPSNKTNLSFGIIPVEVKGGIIPTLDMVGK